MERIRSGHLEENIACAKVTFGDTGEVHYLTILRNSVCHLIKRFPVGKYEIQLRLDWSMLDCNGHPKLDADFIDPKTKKHSQLRGKKKDAHHTDSTPGEGRCYVWEFEGCSLQFSVAVEWLASVSESAYATDSSSAEVIRATDRKAES